MAIWRSLRVGKLDAVLDLDWLRSEPKPFYSRIGRPSVCPEPMLRMLLVGNCYSVRSVRRPCQGPVFRR